MKLINYNIDKCYLLLNDSFVNKYLMKWVNVLRNFKSFLMDRVSELLVKKKFDFGKRKLRV